jgi:hypothetical protein
MNVNGSRSPRRGITAVAVLVCLVVVTMISGALLKVGLAHHAAVRAQERRIQAELLAQAGLDRALFRLAASAGYPGESWPIAGRDLGLAEASASPSGPAAMVTIKVEKASAEPGRKLIKVQADFPPDLPHRVRHSLQLQVELDSLKTGVSR